MLPDNYTGLKMHNKQINMPVNAPKTRLKTNIGINQFIKCDII